VTHSLWTHTHQHVLIALNPKYSHILRVGQNVEICCIDVDVGVGYKTSPPMVQNRVIMVTGTKKIEHMHLGIHVTWE